MKKNQLSQTRGIQFLLDRGSRKSLRTLILFTYFLIFQILIITQKPFLQFDFILYYYFSFGLLFLHHFFFYFLKDQHEVEWIDRHIFFSYFFDFVIMIAFMKSFPQLSSFLLVLQLFMLFIASFDLGFISLSALGFFASLGTSIMNLSAYQAGSTQSILSLTLFNLSYLAVIVISGQLKEEIFNLRSDLNITQKKWKSQAEFSKTLVEKMPLGLLVTHQNNEIALKNSFLSERLKLSDFELRHLVEKLSLRQQFDGRSQSDFEFENPHSLDRIIYQLDRTHYYDEEIEEELSLLLIKDVTEVRQLENQLKQKEKLAAVGQLAAGIAHEIRNPLAGISGSIQMLTEDELAPDQKKLMNIVLKEIDRLNNLITEFLDYAKPEKKPDQIVDLKSLIEDTVLSLKSHKEIKPSLSWKLDLNSKNIYGFSDKLRQAFLNILINAIQAMKDIAEPVIKILISQDAHFVVLSIQDNGVGMTAETQKKMFEPFHTTKLKGTGLGLAITHKILESHSAQIIIKSELNKGTEFKIKFPQIGS
jgi:two-component system sensor histidine kinase PilS (NtrC family)